MFFQFFILLMDDIVFEIYIEEEKEEFEDLLHLFSTVSDQRPSG